MQLFSRTKLFLSDSKDKIRNGNDFIPLCRSTDKFTKPFPTGMELRDPKYETAHETLTLNANFSCSSAKVILLYNKVTSCLSSAGVVAWRHSQGYYWNQLTEISMAEITCRCLQTRSSNIQINQFVWEKENYLVVPNAASKNSVQESGSPQSIKFEGFVEPSGYFCPF